MIALTLGRHAAQDLVKRISIFLDDQHRSRETRCTMPVVGTVGGNPLRVRRDARNFGVHRGGASHLTARQRKRRGGPVRALLKWGVDGALRWSICSCRGEMRQVDGWSGAGEGARRRVIVVVRRLGLVSGGISVRVV